MSNSAQKETWTFFLHNECLSFKNYKFEWEKFGKNSIHSMWNFQYAQPRLGPLLENISASTGELKMEILQRIIWGTIAPFWLHVTSQNNNACKKYLKPPDCYHHTAFINMQNVNSYLMGSLWLWFWSLGWAHRSQLLRRDPQRGSRMAIVGPVRAM